MRRDINYSSWSQLTLLGSPCRRKAVWRKTNGTVFLRVFLYPNASEHTGTSVDAICPILVLLLRSSTPPYTIGRAPYAPTYMYDSMWRPIHLTLWWIFVFPKIGWLWSTESVLVSAVWKETRHGTTLFLLFSSCWAWRGANMVMVTA